MTTISNRTGIAAELTFLRNWGLTFRQAFTDHPTRVYLKRHEETCLDTFSVLSGKKPNFNADLKKGLQSLRGYFKGLDKDKTFTEEKAAETFALLDSIETILFTPVQTVLKL